MILNLSTGNKKLQANESEKFLIWNIPSVTTCPYRTPECERLCYARKAERLYPSVLPSRARNLEESMKPEFSDNMIETISSFTTKKSFKGKKIYFRIHESGDFYNQKYTDDFIEIAKHFPEITFLAYTKSLEFFKDRKLPNNFSVRFSLWDDTEKEQKELNEKVLKFPVFTAFPKAEIEEKSKLFLICGGDCTSCKACYDSRLDIACAIH